MEQQLVAYAGGSNSLSLVKRNADPVKEAEEAQQRVEEVRALQLDALSAR